MQRSRTRKVLSEQCRVLDKYIISKTGKLRQNINRLSEREIRNYKILSESMKTTGNDIRNFFNNMSKQYTEKKKRFRQPRKSTSCDDLDREVNVVSRIIGHVRIFFHRVKLVAKFRNILMFDREILLPVKRTSLTEWYDLPMAVVYGVDRLGSADGSYQREMFPTGRRQREECRFDIRVYGPMEYQLGRALTDRERDWLDDEKFCMMRNTHYHERTKQTRLKLIDLSELNDNSCLSCFRCLKDCLFGCKDGSDQETSDTGSEEMDPGRIYGGARNNLRGTSAINEYGRNADEFNLRMSRSAGNEMRREWDDRRDRLRLGRDSMETTPFSHHDLGPPSYRHGNTDSDNTRFRPRDRVRFNLDESMPRSQSDYSYRHYDH